MLRKILTGALATWLAFAAPAIAAPKVVIVTGGATWVVPSDWSPVGAQIEGIGGGANGGGAYSKKTTGLTGILSGQNIPITVGAGGPYDSPAGDTCFNGCAFFDAKGANGPTGGLASASVGDVKYSGGSGAATAYNPGGGAAGQNGAGRNYASSTVGGAGDLGLGGAGGASGGNGGNGAEWGAAGSGGGGAGGVTCTCSGGSYGGGTTYQSGHVGAQGVLIITYTPRQRSYGGAF